MPGASFPLAEVPAELRERPQWVLWREEPGDGKRRKVPYSARTGARASTTDRSTWSSFDEAVAAWQHRDGYTGVGFVFSPDDPYCGVDLDDCINEEGRLSSKARRIVDSLSTYTEVSPSGRGVKLFLRGKLPPGGRRRGKIEMYDDGRFFTVTGRHLPGTPTAVAEKQAELEELHAENLGQPRSEAPPPAPKREDNSGAALEDDELLEKARQAKNGAKFIPLFDHGDTSAYGNDDSAADLALCGMLVFWTGRDATQLDRLFRRSALLRPKWDERRGKSTYGERTIQTTLQSATEFYEPPKPASRRKGKAGSKTAPPPPAVREAIQELSALDSQPDPVAVEGVLDRFAAGLAGCNRLAVQTARELALRALKDKVQAPARMVDAALAEAAKTSMSASRSGVLARSSYSASDDGLFHRKQTRDGEVEIQLTNFAAQIVTEVTRDDGVETRRSFEIEAHHDGSVVRFEISATRFSSMSWVAQHLGATAVVNAGSGIRDHARAAIQHLSSKPRKRTLFTHLGWRRIGDQWCYLHAGGAVGTVPDVETSLPEQLWRYHLPPPVGEDELVRAVRASLRIVDLLPDPVTMPVYGAIWRAVLGPSDHSVHLLGPTGEGKSELGGRAQQHFGPDLDARHLPGSWSSTANSLEVIAFLAKDALLTVDDFAPEGTPFDIQRQHREAARLFRAQGNNAGRGRLRPDGELRPSKMPRGLILSTGEEVAGGQSVRARNFVLEVPAGGMDWDLLSRCQADGAAGLYAQAMTGFLMWVAGRYEELTELRSRRLQELRALATASGQHRRTPGIVADLAFGLETFLRFARDVGALSEHDTEALWSRGWSALGEAAAAQAALVTSAEPTTRFLELLTSAIASGRAHVVSKDGAEPEVAEAWGWRKQAVGSGDRRAEVWLARGDQIGWLADGQLYLEPDAAYKAAQGAATVDGLSIQPRTLWKRLKEKGLLVSTDDKRKRNAVRVSLQGARREVLHLRPETLLPAEPSQPSQPSQGRRKPPPPGTVDWDGSGAGDGEPSQETVPRPPLDTVLPDAAGTVGTVGTVSETEDLDDFEDP